MLTKARLQNVRMRRSVWHHGYASGSWWLAWFPADAVDQAVRATREYLERHRVTRITMDVVFAYGRKP